MNRRTPPHSIEAEQAVLGSMLRNPRLIPEVQTVLRPEQVDELFYSDAHRRMCRCINDLHQRNSNVDLVLLSNELHRRGEVEDVGGYEYLAKVYDETPTAANALHYAQIVHQTAQQRWVLQACNEWSREALNPAEPGKLDEFGEKLILNLLSKRSGSATARIHKELHEILDDLDKPVHQCQGVPSGLPPLDGIFTFEPGTLTVVGARPSVGKSLGLLQFAHNLAEQGLPTLVMSLEMRRKENVQRLMSLRSATRFSVVRRRNDTSPEEFQRMTEAADALYKLPLFLNCEEQTIGSIKAEVARAKLRENIKVVCVDYLQLVKGIREKGETRSEIIGQISSGLKRLANDHNLIVIAACQLNRETERGPARPKLADLRESGCIEQDADNVILLWRDDNIAETSDGLIKVCGAVAKQRNGPTADFELWRNASFMRFESYQHRETWVK